MPAAAQLACTPLIAAISGQVSLVAVGANPLVEPVVGPVIGAGPGPAGSWDLLALLWDGCSAPCRLVDLNNTRT